MSDEDDTPIALELLQAMRRVQVDFELEAIEGRMRVQDGQTTVRLRITGFQTPIAEIYDNHGNRFNLHPQPAL